MTTNHITQFSKYSQNYIHSSQVQSISALKFFDFINQYQDLELKKQNYKIIDIGCGTGIMLDILIDKVPDIIKQITLLDASSDMLSVVKQKYKDCNDKKNIMFHFINSYFEDVFNEGYDNIVQTNNHYDILVCHFAMQWAKNWQEWIEKMMKLSTNSFIALPIEGTFDNLITTYKKLGISNTFMKFISKHDIITFLDERGIKYQYSTASIDQNFDSIYSFFKHIKNIGTAFSKKSNSIIDFKKILNTFKSAFQTKYEVIYLFVEND